MTAHIVFICKIINCSRDDNEAQNSGAHSAVGPAEVEVRIFALSGCLVVGGRTGEAKYHGIKPLNGGVNLRELVRNFKEIRESNIL